MPHPHRLLLLLCLCLAVWAGESGGGKAKPEAQPNPIPQLDGVTFDVPPFRFSTDVGADAKEQKAYAARLMKPVLETTQHFMKVYGLKPRAFDDYIDFYGASGYEKLVRIDVWQDYEQYLEYVQRTWKTKSIPGAHFTVRPIQDAYGKEQAIWMRQIGTAAEGSGDEQVLRHLYHELGHLFMRTFIVIPVEVPSWIEEGTAELFQFRIGNGTKPEAERLQRQGWLMEIISEGTTIPFPEFIKVRNLDNLDFTWKDPLRSTLQYAQAWSVVEFLIGSPQRADAYLKMLAEFKKSGQKKMQSLGRNANREALASHLYTVQEEIFKQMYGTDLVGLEAMWKEWVGKLYEKELTKKPAIRYHRGEWRLIRASRSKKKEEALAHIARAEEIFKECQEQAPTAPEGWVGMGRINLMFGRRDQAWELFATALEKGSSNPEAMLYGGIARVQRGDPKGAVEPLRKVIEDRPNAFDANYWYGIAVLASRGNVDQAITALASAGGVEKSQTGECTWLEGVAHLMVGRVKPAKMAFLRSLGQPGVPPQATVWLAMATAMEGERAEAMDLLAKAEAHPDKDALNARLAAEGEAKPLPAIAFGERGTPQLDPAADYKAMDPPKASRYGRKR